MLQRIKKISSGLQWDSWWVWQLLGGLRNFFKMEPSQWRTLWRQLPVSDSRNNAFFMFPIPACPLMFDLIGEMMSSVLRNSASNCSRVGSSSQALQHAPLTQLSVAYLVKCVAMYRLIFSLTCFAFPPRVSLALRICRDEEVKQKII